MKVKMPSQPIESQSDIRAQLNTVSLRLLDATSFFSAIQSISRLSEQDETSNLLGYLNSDQFWTMTYAAFQTSLFINIFALVDDDKRCVSFYKIAHQLRPSNTEAVNQLLTIIREISRTYGYFRNKIFAHTDPNWAVGLGVEFDAAGFTWESIDNDLKRLDYVRQCLIAVSESRPIPSMEDAARTFWFDHLRSEAVRVGANKLVSFILAGIERERATQSE